MVVVYTIIACYVNICTRSSVYVAIDTVAAGVCYAYIAVTCVIYTWYLVAVTSVGTYGVYCVDIRAYVVVGVAGVVYIVIITSVVVGVCVCVGISCVRVDVVGVVNIRVCR